MTDLTASRSTTGIRGACVPYTLASAGWPSVCSTVNDDFDVDFVEDNIDNCPALYNPTIIVPGTKRQSDIDRDGLGDICDPAGTFDDEFDGIPDDVVAFAGNISCRIPAAGQPDCPGADGIIDLDGDIDSFPDTGETGRVELDIQNTGGTLTDATIFLQTDRLGRRVHLRAGRAGRDDPGRRDQITVGDIGGVGPRASPSRRAIPWSTPVRPLRLRRSTSASR